MQLNVKGRKDYLESGVWGRTLILEMLIVARSQHAASSELFSLEISMALTITSLFFNTYWY